MPRKKIEEQSIDEVMNVAEENVELHSGEEMEEGAVYIADSVGINEAPKTDRQRFYEMNFNLQQMT